MLVVFLPQWIEYLFAAICVTFTTHYIWNTDLHREKRKRQSAEKTKSTTMYCIYIKYKMGLEDIAEELFLMLLCPTPQKSSVMAQISHRH